MARRIPAPKHAARQRCSARHGHLGALGGGAGRARPAARPGPQAEGADERGQQGRGERCGRARVPFEDAEPIGYGLVWRAADNTTAVRAFARAALKAATGA
ncbi:hypothetical protein AB8O64_19285 [Streptomyces sp. QH1-20]|uniref:hypothetical protein n=1 Tax=Streptomyces sp. QH1-20 TaxID=3240934 RepID=UPI003517D590